MKSARSRKMNLVVKLGIFAFAAYVVVSLVSLQMEISAKRGELATYQQQLEQELLEVEELERQIALLEDPDYLTRIARDQLGMGYSDEHVFRDASGS